MNLNVTSEIRDCLYLFGTPMALKNVRKLNNYATTVLNSKWKYEKLAVVGKRESPGFSVTTRADYKRLERKKIPVCNTNVAGIYLSLALSVKIIFMSRF